jgi:hypothetical protein
MCLDKAFTPNYFERVEHRAIVITQFGTRVSFLKGPKGGETGEGGIGRGDAIFSYRYHGKPHQWPP